VYSDGYYATQDIKLGEFVVMEQLIENPFT